MKRALIFRLVSLLTCGLLRMAADALETEQQLLDIAPFALPGTPANEVRFTHTIKDNTPERYRTAL